MPDARCPMIYCSKGHENPTGTRFCQQCGENLALGIYSGKVLGDRYQIVRELGHGGFGRTYLAEDLNRFKERCVLKEFAPQVQGTYALQKAEELFEREAGVLYKLQHPQIPRFREMFRVKQEDKGLLFLVQDFVEGKNYRDLSQERSSQGIRFTEADITQLLLQLLPVLDYIHSMGVIHRDISPDNLMLRHSDLLPVLIDFGGVKQIAADVESQFTQAPTGSPGFATRLGKVGYAPEEQMQYGLVYPSSDLYALAATMLVLLTGKEPTQLIDPHNLEWNWRREVNVNPMLGGVLDRMLQRQQSLRYPSAKEALQALTAYSQPTIQPTMPPLSIPPTVSPPVVSTPPTPTVAIAPNAVNAPIASPPSQSPQPSSNGGFGLVWKTVLVSVLIAIACGIGWWAGNSWIQSQSGTETPSPSPDDTPTPTPTTDTELDNQPTFSKEEQDRKAALRQRRDALGVSASFFSRLVDEAYLAENPNRRSNPLTDKPEDTSARAAWDKKAAELLSILEKTNLSSSAFRQMGSYDSAWRDRTKAEVNKLYISSRSLYDLADAAFGQYFPKQEGKNLTNQAIGQVWQGFVYDKLQAIKSGTAFERIVFDPGAVSKSVSSTLKPGEGKIYIAGLSAGQLMDIELQTDKNTRFSIYLPSGGTASLLEDSTEKSWSGTLPEKGFYEFVVVSKDSTPLDYQLNLKVKNTAPTTPEPTDSPL